MFLALSCSLVCPIHWSQVLSREWRCNWSNTDRRCSSYIWVIIKLIAYQSTTCIRGLVVVVSAVPAARPSLSGSGPPADTAVIFKQIVRPCDYWISIEIHNMLIYYKYYNGCYAPRTDMQGMIRLSKEFLWPMNELQILLAKCITILVPRSEHSSRCMNLSLVDFSHKVSVIQSFHLFFAVSRSNIFKNRVGVDPRRHDVHRTSLQCSGFTLSTQFPLVPHIHLRELKQHWFG